MWVICFGNTGYIREWLDAGSCCIKSEGVNVAIAKPLSGKSNPASMPAAANAAAGVIASTRRNLPSMATRMKPASRPLSFTFSSPLAG